MFRFKYQHVARMMLSASFFLTMHSLVGACDEDIESEYLSVGGASSHQVSPEVSKKELFPDLLADTLKSIPFLSPKEGVHILSQRFKDASADPSSYTTQNGQYSIVLGTGLKCLRARSNGVPFDVLGFIASAEATRRAFGFRDIIHYIGDGHARSCGFNQESFSSLEELNAEARQQKLLYERIAHRLGLGRTYKVVLASDFQATPEFVQIKERVFAAQEVADETEYTKLEVADIEYLRKHENVLVKFSWVMHDEKEKDAKRDECSYDYLYKSIFTREDMSFLYARSGVNLSQKKTYSTTEIDASPYSYPASDTRITLRPVDRSAEDKIRAFSTRFLFKLSPQDEETLKQRYLDHFTKTLKRKHSSFVYSMDDMRTRMDRLSADVTGVLTTEFPDMDQQLSEIPAKVIKDRDEILMKYHQERGEKLRSYRDRYQVVVDKALSKYQDILDTVLSTFPGLSQSITIDDEEILQAKMQKTINYLTAEDTM